MGSVLFVHGTAVRLDSYLRGFEKAREVAAAAGIKDTFIECAWGDPLGIEFEGYSLPEPPSEKQRLEEEEDIGRWSWRLADPLFELDQLKIRDESAEADAAPAQPDTKPEWEGLWDSIEAYQPSEELKLLLERGGLSDYWEDAWSTIVKRSDIPHEAFEASAHELPEVSRALARAIIAQLHVCAVEDGAPGPNRVLRDKLFERLVVDWDQEVYGLGTFLARVLQRVGTSALREHRYGVSDMISLPVGDILLYQSRGDEVRKYIRKKIESADPPVTVIAHSLGGIACVDLLALPNPPAVDHLVTAGSQAPLLYEIGALYSLKMPEPLPAEFPPWLNLYDRNDFLSYVGHRLWKKVKDVEIESGQPFPDSHSAYFGNEATWAAIRKFIGR